MYATVTQSRPSLFGVKHSHSVPALDDVLSRGALSSEELELFASARPIHRTISAGQSFVAQGETCDHVYIMLEGWAICQKMHEDGCRQILDLVLPGSILGYGRTRNTPYGYEAKTDCKVIAIPREAFSDVLLRSPKLCLRCTEIFATAQSRAFERMSHLGRLTAKERVAGLIVELATRLQETEGTATASIGLPLTQQDIGDMLGLAHETVCRILVAFRTQRLTTWRAGKLEIHNLVNLADIAGSDLEIHEAVAMPGQTQHHRLARAA
jgi:CRP/FNR family transcriptional regulator